MSPRCCADWRQRRLSKGLDKEPYMLGKVWGKIKITRAQAALCWDKK